MNKLIYLLFLLLTIVSCNTQSVNSNVSDEVYNETMNHLNTFNNMGEVRYDVDGSNQSWERFGTKWKQDTIRYYINYLPLVTNKDTIINYFNNSDKAYISKLTEQAVAEWSPHIKKVIYEVDTPLKSDFDILWKPLENDGKGKRLAVSDGPLDNEMESKPIMIMDLVDMYDIVKNRNNTKYKYYNVILHELGHMLAGLAHDNSIGVMNSAFNFDKLQLDDICGARIIYKNKDNFIYNGIEYIHISNKDKNKSVSLNFKEHEFISKCGVYDGEHFIAKNLINALQYIREVYKTPIQITSSYRDIKCNHNAGGAENSQHLFMNALDWKFIGKNANITQKKYFNDIVGKKSTLEILLGLKIKGFGAYAYNSMLNHIDVRNAPIWNTSYKGIGYMTWGKYKGAFEIGDEFKEFD